MSDGTGSGTTGQDYIRQAVELADRWRMQGDYVVTPVYDVDLFHVDSLPQMQLDALAAQLERQFAERAALPQWINYSLRAPFKTSYSSRDFRRIPKERAAQLTMWRIKYFVDSVVLIGKATEQGESDELE